MIISEKDPEKLSEIRENINKNLEDFLLKTKNAKYSLPVMSIICCSSKKTYERYNKWDESKGFYCSQLVAAAYLNMGILTYEKATANYLPGKFSQTSILPFTEGFNLGPEHIVDLAK